MGLEGQFYAVVRRREWGPGEKALFARRNDLRSVRVSLDKARNQHPLNPELIEHLEDQHVAMLDRLHAVEREHGFSGDHKLEVERAIEDDRRAMWDRISGLAPIKRSLETVSLAMETARLRAENPGRYPDAAAQLAYLEGQHALIVAKLRGAMA